MIRNIVFSLLCCLPTLIWAQVDQLTAMQNIPHGTEYVCYYSVDEVKDGLYSGTAKEATYYFSHLNNELGKTNGFIIQNKFYKDKDTPNWTRKDHYTRPAFIYTAMNGVRHMILGDVIYEFEPVRGEDNLRKKDNLKIKYVYVPKSIAESKADKNKMIYMLKNGGLSKSRTVSDTDHEEAIREYLEAMDKIQKETVYSAAEIAEMEKLGQTRGTNEAARLRQVAKDLEETHSSPDANQDKVTVRVSGGKVCLVQGGSSYTVNSSQTFDCDEDVYYGTFQDGGRNCTSTKQGLAIPKGKCGQEIQLTGR